jgi:hypothetical protein
LGCKAIELPTQIIHVARHSIHKPLWINAQPRAK